MAFQTTPTRLVPAPNYDPLIMPKSLIGVPPNKEVFMAAECIVTGTSDYTGLKTVYTSPDFIDRYLADVWVSPQGTSWVRQGTLARQCSAKYILEDLGYQRAIVTLWECIHALIQQTPSEPSSACDKRNLFIMTYGRGDLGFVTAQWSRMGDRLGWSFEADSSEEPPKMNGREIVFYRD